MRFRQLELVRYGGFAERVFDFGGGHPDLHLVVGPNEAGKSTTLQAIGDFLFGIPAQSSQNWRYDYGQLRLRALIENDGEVLDVTRRKGNRDTLLSADGSPFSCDPLAPMLGGMDRSGFERMFGLDHAKLRQGGESILSGRDDAARITLEAGTGVSHIGNELARLTDAASALFKPGGQNPPVNRLMRERTEALAQVRQTSISDAQWTQSRQRRTEAEERRAALIKEAAALEREQARLDRLGRARAPCARLADARGELAKLDPLPELPLDSAARVTQARAERVTASELSVQVAADLARVDEAIAGVEPPGKILTQRERIEALDERRPVIAKAATDLERRRAELERVDARLTAARSEAGLASDATLPGPGWRKRAGAHIEAQRQVMSGEASSSKARAKLVRDREQFGRERAALEDDSGLAELTAALALLPADSEQRVQNASAEADRKLAVSAERIIELSPWRGTFADLRVLIAPTEADAAAVRSAIDVALAGARAVRKEAEAAEASAIRAEAKLKSLSAGGALPTAEVVSAARGHRDVCLRQVLERLLVPRSADNEEVGRALADAVIQADQLADRRDAEATRVAEYDLVLVAAEEARALLAASNHREQGYSAELKQVEESWASRLHALGFNQSISPADLAGWLAKRTATLEADRERVAAQQAHDQLKSNINQARAGISNAYAACGGGAVPADDRTLIPRARERSEQLSANASTRIRLTGQIASVEQALAELDEDDTDLQRIRADLEAELKRLVGEAGLPANTDEVTLADALETFNQVIEETGARDGIDRQVSAMEQDRAAFDAELNEILAVVGQAPTGDTINHARELATSLRTAVRSSEVLMEHASERRRLIAELERIQIRHDKAEASINESMNLAGVSSETDLDLVVAGVARREVARAAERGALDELAGADNGAGLDALTAEIASLSFEEEAGARARIGDRRSEVAAEREVVGGLLNAADEEVARAARESAAADAQQTATDTGAALAQAAEEHIQAITAAALLRWMLDRHRATNQAPLIARAGALFGQVTGGAFKGLTVGYANDDRPIILATRADGAEVGVEALSEGTRDQLYLALRLGSIEGRSAAGGLPIVCDDLLITADDTRSAALLKVLAAAAGHSQVIVFSHHTHLIDIAHRAIGAKGFKLHMIEPSAKAA